MKILAGYVESKINIDQARDQISKHIETCPEDLIDVVIDAIDRGQFNADFIISFTK